MTETFHSKAQLIGFRADPRGLMTKVGDGWKKRYGAVLDGVDAYATKLADGSLTTTNADEILTQMVADCRQGEVFLNTVDGENTVPDLLVHMRTKVAAPLMAEEHFCTDPWKWITNQDAWTLAKNAAIASSTNEYFDFLEAMNLWKTTYAHARLGAFAIINKFILDTRPDTYANVCPSFATNGTEDDEISESNYNALVASMEDSYALNLPGGPLTREGTRNYWAAHCRRRADANCFDAILETFTGDLMWQGVKRGNNKNYIKAVSRHIAADVSFPGAIKTAYPG